MFSKKVEVWPAYLKGSIGRTGPLTLHLESKGLGLSPVFPIYQIYEQSLPEPSEPQIAPLWNGNNDSNLTIMIKKECPVWCLHLAESDMQ